MQRLTPCEALVISLLQNSYPNGATPRKISNNICSEHNYVPKTIISQMWELKSLGILTTQGIRPTVFKFSGMLVHRHDIPYAILAAEIARVAQ